MGVKTAEELIKEGVRLAGIEYNADDTRPLSDLKDWLSSVALGWPWPETIFNFGPTLYAGTNYFLLGYGATVGATSRILRVSFPLKIVYGEDRLPDKINQEAFSNNMSAANVPVGLPDKASYTRNWTGVYGKVLIAFNKKPATDLQLDISTQIDLAVDYTIASIPWYPNDSTIKQSIAYFTSKYHDGPASEKTLKFEDDLAIMVRNDKLKFGVIDSFVMKMNRNPRDR